MMLYFAGPCRTLTVTTPDITDSNEINLCRELCTTMGAGTCPTINRCDAPLDAFVGLDIDGGDWDLKGDIGQQVIIGGVTLRQCKDACTADLRCFAATFNAGLSGTTGNCYFKKEGAQLVCPIESRAGNPSNDVLVYPCALP